MKKGKRILSLLLATLMILSLAACGGTGDTTSSGSPEGNNTSAPDVSGNEDVTPQEATYPLTTEKKTLSVYIRDNSSGVIGDYGRVAAFQAAAERLGVELEFVHPTTGGEADQFNLMIGSGKYPDIIVWEFSTAAMGLSELIDSGILIDMDGLIRQYAPNYLKVLERDPSYPKEVRSDEGKYQAFYTFNVSIPLSSGPVFREDLLAKYGLELPKTVDEWTNVMTTLKEKDPNVSYPLTASKSYVGEVWFRELLPAYNTRTEFCLGDNGQVVYGPATENFKAYLAKLAEWYNAGLIDPEFMSNDNKALNAKIADGTSAVATMAIGSGIRSITENTRPNNPDFKLTGVAWPVLNAGDTSSYVLEGGVAHTSVQAAITSSCADPVLATQVLDYFYSEEGGNLISWGIEGESYTVENGKKTFTDKIMNSPDGRSASEAILDYALPVYGFVNAMDNDAYIQMNITLPEQGEARTLWQSLDSGANLPKLVVAQEDADEYRMILNEVKTYVQEMYIKFITGQANLDSDWDTYMNTLNGMDLPYATECMQKAYNAYQNR
jgi:putative aldouronate transport system substrate-binding protein